MDWISAVARRISGASQGGVDMYRAAAAAMAGAANMAASTGTTAAQIAGGVPVAAYDLAKSSKGREDVADAGADGAAEGDDGDDGIKEGEGDDGDNTGNGGGKGDS